METITIVGTGLIGTSIALGIKNANNNLYIRGYDNSPKHSSESKTIGALDESCESLRDAVSNASLVILATPVNAMQSILDTISPLLMEGCVVTDTGSTKQSILSWAKQSLPEHVSFVGGHPMAGKELSGPWSADASLFDNKTYCVIPTETSTKEAVEIVIGLAETINAVPFFIGAQEHDSFVAAVSHLPHILSVALLESTASSSSWDDIGRLASSGFKDVSRLASGDPIMRRDICLTNQQSIIHWIDVFTKELEKIRDLLKQESAVEIQELFEKSRTARETWLAGSNKYNHFAGSNKQESVMDRLGELFLGKAIFDKQKRFRDMLSLKNNPKDRSS